MHRWVGVAAGVWVALSVGRAGAHTVDLLRQSFEQPAAPYVANCGEAVDNRPLAQLHPPPLGRFVQTGRVETLLLRTPGYTSPMGRGGQAALALRSDGVSKLAWVLDAEFLDRMNIAFSLSAIDVRGCGGPFPVTRPKVRISVYDAPEGAFGFTEVSESALKDRKEVEGTAGTDPFTFTWTSALVSLASGDPTDGHIAITFELVEGGYAVIDNLAIVGSHEEGDLGDGGVVTDPDGGVAPDAGLEGAGQDAAMDGRVAVPPTLPPVVAADASMDAPTPITAPTDEGCGCRIGGSRTAGPACYSLVALVACLLAWRRRASRGA